MKQTLFFEDGIKYMHHATVWSLFFIFFVYLTETNQKNLRGWDESWIYKYIYIYIYFNFLWRKPTRHTRTTSSIFDSETHYPITTLPPPFSRAWLHKTPGPEASHHHQISTKPVQYSTAHTSMPPKLCRTNPYIKIVEFVM